jgi:DNA-binding XRE family transcriptional regulator
VANKWRDLYDKIPADRRARIEEQVGRDLVDMRLAEVRRAQELTQQELAEKLNVNQAWVSKLEHQADMYVSTLRSYINAMGGELEIVARFSDGTVRLTNFDQLSQAHETLRSPDDQRLTSTTPIAETTIKVWGAPPVTGPLDAFTIWEFGDSNTSARSRTPTSRTPQQRRAA